MTDFSNQVLQEVSVPASPSIPLETWLAGLLFVVLLSRDAIVQAVGKAASEAERKHDRGELLRAYRCRRLWKKSDVPHLRTLNLSPAATRRLDRLTGKGRPIVRPHQELAVTVAEKIVSLHDLFRSDAPPSTRLSALKKWPWWPHYVEALYRGEYERAKRLGHRSASETSEDLVGKRLGMSAAHIHKICGDIRRTRREDYEAANFPPITLVEFQEWLNTGHDRHLFEGRAT